MNEIRNYNVYSNGMKKSVQDKLFFKNLIQDIRGIVDFGCADGQLLKQIHEDFPKWDLIGIDADKQMLNMAKEICKNAKYIYANKIPLELSKNAGNMLLNLSSVLHEIYSYSKPEEITAFWNSLFSCGFRYIAIRDFMLSSSAFREADIQDIRRVMNKTDHYLEAFTKVWGEIQKQNNLLHYLMKYRYRVNWEREVLENYFPMTVEELLSMIPTHLYKVSYFRHYVLPFTKHQVAHDFGIEIKDNTHIQILLELKENKDGKCI